MLKSTGLTQTTKSTFIMATNIAWSCGSSGGCGFDRTFFFSMSKPTVLPQIAEAFLKMTTLCSLRVRRKVGNSRPRSMLEATSDAQTAISFFKVPARSTTFLCERRNDDAGVKRHHRRSSKRRQHRIIMLEVTQPCTGTVSIEKITAGKMSSYFT
jgi:hypothetical protein